MLGRAVLGAAALESQMAGLETLTAGQLRRRLRERGLPRTSVDGSGTRVWGATQATGMTRSREAHGPTGPVDDAEGALPRVATGGHRDVEAEVLDIASVGRRRRREPEVMSFTRLQHVEGDRILRERAGFGLVDDEADRPDRYLGGHGVNLGGREAPKIPTFGSGTLISRPLAADRKTPESPRVRGTTDRSVP